MKIKLVTMTGADDSTNPLKLIELSQKYPFVEWGILSSRSQTGGKRFPSSEWMFNLYRLCLDPSIEPPNLSCHLCGKWVRDLLIGDTADLSMFMCSMFGMFNRVQINTHGEIQRVDKRKFVEALRRMASKEILIQFDDINSRLYEIAKLHGRVNARPFFDLSYGAGVVPEKWPELIEGEYCGYAGGLGPDNLEMQLEKISEVVGDKTIWIDMETKVRSNNDALFDIEKVTQCLEIAKQYV